MFLSPEKKKKKKKRKRNKKKITRDLTGYLFGVFLPSIGRIECQVLQVITMISGEPMPQRTHT
jgi:hypothetical protein